MTGLREPAAKGAMVKGTRAAETSLDGWCGVLVGCESREGSGSRSVPLKRPVVATMSGIGFRNGGRVVRWSLLD